MSTHRIELRPTRPTDLTWVLAAEQYFENAPYVGQWSRAQHEGAIAATDEAHFVAEQNHEPVGYVILTGLENPHLTINLQRIVVVKKGNGYGRQILQWVKAFAFDTLGYHRLWLDVISSNQRAQSLYKREGFVVEGILRDSWKTASGYEDMLIMSMLAPEYRAAPQMTGQATDQATTAVGK
ncbi:GNAT family protein [Leptolyngbya sp. BC1307]|uniref:GNAT family N-acetyltransferase n=1 Tax=Leptolyngbya sp. BC1307 TaxID=2029589 RepID=UPI000EFC0E6B|nr:GNAT family protein [Leptolyngbya sp. BC1307]